MEKLPRMLELAGARLETSLHRSTRHVVVDTVAAVDAALSSIIKGELDASLLPGAVGGCSLRDVAVAHNNTLGLHIAASRQSRKRESHRVATPTRPLEHRSSAVQPSPSSQLLEQVGSTVREASRGERHPRDSRIERI